MENEIISQDIPNFGNGNIMQVPDRGHHEDQEIEHGQPDFDFINNPKPEPKQSIFTVKKASEWIRDAKGKPKPMHLFDEFWIEHDVTILFASTGVGKTALAVQIANSISRGVPIPGFKMESRPKKVLFFDFELSDLQFITRYSITDTDSGMIEHEYQFNDNFLRVELTNPENAPDDYKGTFEDYLKDQIIRTIVEVGAKIVIIDNITYLSDCLETSKDTLPLVKWLKQIAREHGLSMLILAHTPKVSRYRILEICNLQGSAMISNFVDGAFSIGESPTGLKYIKNIKCRSDQKRYDINNVAVCKYGKDVNFLQFTYVESQPEQELLPKFNDETRGDLINQVKELSGKGSTQREIARELGIGASTVNKYLNQQ